jgi:hypothetical protein
MRNRIELTLENEMLVMRTQNQSGVAVTVELTVAQAKQFYTILAGMLRNHEIDKAQREQH